MLIIHPSRPNADIKKYFSDGFASGEYFSGTQNAPGRWFGKGAGRLGLGPEVTKAAFWSLCDNVHPGTAESLTPRTRSDRRPGYDFCFHVPKSVSLAFAIGGDERIPDAVLRASRATMQEMEAVAGTRVRGDGRDETRQTGNMVWAEFIHYLARPQDRLADPLIHIHNYVFNATYDTLEARWKAVEVGHIKAAAPYFQARAHARLQKELEDLGYVIEMDNGTWEIQGCGRPLIQKFSSRGEHVEHIAESRGIVRPSDKAEVARKTRKAKARDVPESDYERDWASRLSDADRRWAQGARFARQRREDTQTEETESGTKRREFGRPGSRPLAEAVTYAMGRAFERSAVVPEHRLIAETQLLTDHLLEDHAVKEEIARQGGITRTLRGHVVVTTPEVLREERRLVDLVRAGVGRFRPMAPKVPELSSLESEQQLAARHVLSSRDQVIIVEGRAGVGKTVAMAQSLQAALRSGEIRDIVVLGATTKCRDVLRSEGFPHAETLAKFLSSPELQNRATGGLVWIDEAGLVGTKDALRTMEVVRDRESRLLTTGDTNQHKSISRGNILGLWRDHAGVIPAVLTETRRQRGELKEVVELLAAHKAEAGFDRLTGLGAVKELDPAELWKRAAADYVKAMADGDTALIVSPTREGCRRANEQVRRALKDGGVVKKKERTLIQLRPIDSTAADRSTPGFYRPGMIVEFVRNTGWKPPFAQQRSGFIAGTRWVVTTVGSRGVGVERVRGAHDREDPKVEVRDLPISKPDNFTLFEKAEIRVAVGDKLRITKSGRTRSIWTAFFERESGVRMKPKRDLANGSVGGVRRFTRDRDIQLENNLVVPENFGHIAHAYASTSMLSQSMKADRVIAVLTKACGPSVNPRQLYVTVSRAVKGVTIYTEDARALRDAVTKSDEWATAMDVVRDGTDDAARAQRSRRREFEEVRDAPAQDRKRDGGRER